MDAYPHELSGGQRQRIIIAIALSCDAELLIADEPTRNLDVTIQAGILKLIAKLQNQLKVSVLFIANNLGLVSATCNNLAMLHQGKIIETGATKEVLSSPRHPYTRAFIDAIPKDKHNGTYLEQAAETNRIGAYAAGCPNIDLCTEMNEKCQQLVPPLKPYQGSHYVACHRVEEMTDE